MWFLVFLLIVGVALGEVRKDTCEAKHDRCVFDCTNAYPFEPTKREGCEMRCKLNLALCKSAQIINRAGKEVRDFLEGFTKGN